MTLIVRAFPGRARDRSELDAFLGEMHGRADEARRFYQAYGDRIRTGRDRRDRDGLARARDRVRGDR